MNGVRVLLVAVAVGSVEVISWHAFLCPPTLFPMRCSRRSLARCTGRVVHMSAASRDWQQAVDPQTGQQYWYNSATSQSSWEPPADVTDEAVSNPGAAGSKEQQLALLLANGEKRSRKRAERQAQEAEERAAAVVADREAREARAAMLSAGARAAMREARTTSAALAEGGVATRKAVLNDQGLQPKNAILAMNAAKAEAALERRRNAGPSFVAALNPIKPGVVWYKEPSLLVFFGAKVGLILYILFFGIHNQYTGDFGPFIKL